MNRTLPLVAMATLLLGACAHGPDLPSDYIGTLRTETSASVIAACIAQATGGTATNNGPITIIEASTAQPPRRYTVSEDKGQTVVVMQGMHVDNGSTADHAATNCLVQSAPAA